MATRSPIKQATDNRDTRKEPNKGPSHTKKSDETKTEVKPEQSGPGGEGTVKLEQHQSQSQPNENHKQENRGQRGGYRGRGGRGRGGQQHGGGFRGQQGQYGGGQGFQQQGQSHQQRRGGPSEQDQEQESYLLSGPKEERKFAGRCRLFVGNITPDVTEEEFREMFKPYGEASEVFVNGSKGFGFIRLDYRHNAEAAKAALDGTQKKGRLLRIRFANHGAALKVKNISPYITNELLEQAFSQFGEVERAIVIADDRGRSAGEGIVEFARKPGAQQALKRINDGVFLLSASTKPCSVEMLEQKDEEDGLSEKFLFRNEQCRQDREKEPRFAPPGSFEYRFGMKHKEIDEMEKQGYERVKKDAEQARKNLEGEMESAMYDYQAEQIRQDLMRQQEELKRLEELKTQHMRYRQEMDMRRQEEERMIREEEERRRDMIMMRNDSMRGGGQGGQQGQLMDQQGGMREGLQRGQGNPPLPPPPAPPASLGMENNGNSPMPGSKLSSTGFGAPGGGIGEGGMGQGGNRPKPGGMPESMGSRGGQMRPSRFDQQGGGNYEGGFGSRGPAGMGGQNSSLGGGGMPGQSGLFSGVGGGQGNMPSRGGGMDRRREGGPNRDDFDNKRMRRF